MIDIARFLDDAQAREMISEIDRGALAGWIRAGQATSTVSGESLEGGRTVLDPRQGWRGRDRRRRVSRCARLWELEGWGRCGSHSIPRSSGRWRSRF